MSTITDRLVTRMEVSGVSGVIAALMRVGAAQKAMDNFVGPRTTKQIMAANAQLATMQNSLKLIATTAAIGIGIAVVGSLVRAGKQAEDTQRRLEGFYGAANAPKVMNWQAGFAQKNHQALTDVRASMAQLLQEGVNPTVRRLQDLSDLAAKNPGATMTSISGGLAKALKGDLNALAAYGVSSRDIWGRGGGPEGVLRAIEERAGGASNALKGTLQGSLNDLSTSTTRLSESLGRQLIPGLTAFVSLSASVVNAFNAINTATSGVAGAILLLAGTGGVLLLMAKVVRDLIALMRTFAISEALVEALSGPKGWMAITAGLLAAGAAGAAIHQMTKTSPAGAGGNGLPTPTINPSLGKWNPLQEIVRHLIGNIGDIGRIGINASELPGMQTRRLPPIIVHVEPRDGLERVFESFLNQALAKLRMHGANPLGSTGAYGT